MNIQMQPNKMVDGDVTPVPLSEAEFYSLYIGVPGAYEWVADFAELDMTRAVGELLSGEHGYEYVENIMGGAE